MKALALFLIPFLSFSVSAQEQNLVDIDTHSLKEEYKSRLEKKKQADIQAKRKKEHELLNLYIEHIAQTISTETEIEVVKKSKPIYRSNNNSLSEATIYFKLTNNNLCELRTNYSFDDYDGLSTYSIHTACLDEALTTTLNRNPLHHAEDFLVFLEHITSPGYSDRN